MSSSVCCVSQHCHESCLPFRASPAPSKSSIESHGLMGTAERSFLTPRQTQEAESATPSLDEFDMEMDIYKVCRVKEYEYEQPVPVPVRFATEGIFQG